MRAAGSRRRSNTRRVRPVLPVVRWLQLGAAAAGAGAVLFAGPAVASADDGRSSPDNPEVGSAGTGHRASASAGPARRVADPSPAADRAASRAPSPAPRGADGARPGRIRPAGNTATERVARPVTPSGAATTSGPTPRATAAGALRTADGSDAADSAVAVARRDLAAAQTPAPGPLLTGLIGALERLGRDLEQLFAFRNPVTRPVQLVQTDDSRIVGALGAYSNYGNPLTYAVERAPTQGSVSVDADGNWTYSPDVSVDDSLGGTDEFTVSVLDSGFHLFGQSGRVTVPVTVYRNPQQDSIALVDAAQQVVASADGSRVFAIGSRGMVSVIDAAIGSASNGTVIDTVIVELGLPFSGDPDQVGPVPAPVSALASSPDGSQIWLGSNLQDYNTGTTDSEGGSVFLDLYTVTALDFQTSVDDAGAPVTNQVVTAQREFDAPVVGIAVDDTAGQVYVLTGGGHGDKSQVHIVDAQTLASAGVAEVGAGATQVAVAPSGKVFVVNTLDDTVDVIDPADGTVLASIDVIGSLPQGIAFTGGGDYAAVANLESNNVALIDIDPGSPTAYQVVSLITTGGSPEAITASPGGRYIYVAKFNDDAVAVIETRGYTLATSIETGDGPTSLALGDGGQLYTANLYDDDATVLSVTTAPDPGVGPSLDQAVQGGTAKDAITIYNFTSDTMTISDWQNAPYGGNGAEPSKFPIGTTIASNTYFQATGLPVSSSRQTYTLGFLVLRTGGVGTPTWTLDVAREWNLQQEARVNSYSRDNFKALQLYSATNLTKNELVLVNKDESTIVVDARDTKLAVETLNKYCFGGSNASCSVETRTWVQGVGQREIKGSPVNNQTYDIPADTTITESWTSGFKNNVEIGLKVATGKLFSELWSAEVTAKYGHEWNQSYTFSQAVKITVPPRTRVWLEWAEVQREYKSDWTMKLGNTTFVVKNVEGTVPLGNNRAEYFINSADIPPKTRPAAEQSD